MVLICGPNGSGKSTVSKESGLQKRMPVLDPDQIAKNEKLSPLEAGKTTANRARKFLAEGRTFAKESTLSSKFDFTLMNVAQKKGYTVELVYVGVEQALDSIERVQSRAELGGHNVPKKDVERRYKRSMESLEKALATVDKATIYDNSKRKSKLVATIKHGQVKALANDLPKWLAKAVPALEKKGLEASFKKSRNLGLER
jgi:predicted ABC-type ATPase